MRFASRLCDAEFITIGSQGNTVERTMPRERQSKLMVALFVRA